MALLNPGGAIAQFQRNDCSISPVEVIWRGGVRNITAHPPDLGDADSVLNLLYEAYSECNPMADAQIKAGFHELYQLMNGAPLEKMDEIINPVCFLCREHERSGFEHGVQIGMLLARELAE